MIPDHSLRNKGCRAPGQLPTRRRQDGGGRPRAANRREFMQGLISAAAVRADHRGRLLRLRPGCVVLSDARPSGEGRPHRLRRRGGVLANEHDPNYVNIVAVSDIRPSNPQAASSTATPAVEQQPPRSSSITDGHNADKDIKVFEKYLQDLLADRDLGIEMIICSTARCRLHSQGRDRLPAGRAASRGCAVREADGLERHAVQGN